MSWLILVLGSIGGSVLSAYSRRDRDNVFLRIISSLVPLACTGVFFYLQYKSGGLKSIAGAVQLGGSSIVSGVVSAAAVAAVCWGISKGIGALIVNYIDTKR